MIFKVLAKKFVREILEMLENVDEMYFSEIMNKLNTHQGTVGRVLGELVDYNLLSKREDEEGKKLNKTYYSITDDGREALEFYEYADRMENSRKSKFHNEIKGNVGQVINIDKAEGLEINFKKGN
ncbi:DNA-binding HxlR family transcriptional regulator [Methanococcus maripaludis]|uniref:DNA-binding HxlR family transcriptional regulator n=1 Tax=Methanococcus maripaludis TaxID=39152 RepID=A0A7J9P0K7_METMI|nr:helix-turn-helix transcriptional regulator [Methanococcus maripaludis]MBA2853492.1 DNA-binding HxlR family transcriptional regulator [Methanococcus maripaludis]